MSEGEYGSLLLMFVLNLAVTFWALISGVVDYHHNRRNIDLLTAAAIAAFMAMVSLQVAIKIVHHVWSGL